MGIFTWLTKIRSSTQPANPPAGLSNSVEPPAETVASAQPAHRASCSAAKTDPSFGHGVCASPAEFVSKAMTGPARCSVPIKEAGGVAAALAKALGDTGISSSGIIEILPYGLLGVCTRCNQYCAGQGLLMLSTFSMMGNVMFTGNSGGAERMMEGKCLNYSCENTTFDLFWCPDLDPGMLADLRSRGINIDPNTQRQRDRFWKPKR